MNSSIVEFFDNLLNLELDNALYNFIKVFRINWAQKSDQYIDYLSNSYIGVYEIKFSIKDDESFLEYFGLEKNELQKDVYRIKGINKAFKVSSNCILMLMVYLMHKFKIASKLPTKINEDAMKELFYLIHYKMISSIDNHFFKYKIDISIAKAINERLHSKYYLKQFNSWNEILEYKFNTDVLSGTYKNKLENLTTDNYILVINDMKTKISSLFKNYYIILNTILQEDKTGVKSTSLITSGEDGEELRDITNRRDRYVQNILTIYKSNVDLIIPELISIVQGVLVGVKTTDAHAILQYLSGKNDIPKLKENIEFMMQLAFEALSRKPVQGTLKERIYDVVHCLKTFYISNEGIKKFTPLKKYLESMVKKIIKTNNTYRIRNVVLFIPIYYPCRAFLTKQGN